MNPSVRAIGLLSIYTLVVLWVASSLGALSITGVFLAGTFSQFDFVYIGSVTVVSTPVLVLIAIRGHLRKGQACVATKER